MESTLPQLLQQLAAYNGTASNIIAFALILALIAILIIMIWATVVLVATVFNPTSKKTYPKAYTENQKIKTK